jgi:hypothetical protein
MEYFPEALRLNGRFVLVTLIFSSSVVNFISWDPVFRLEYIYFKNKVTNSKLILRRDL